jgi:hypothetical protein
MDETQIKKARMLGGKLGKKVRLDISVVFIIMYSLMSQIHRS